MARTRELQSLIDLMPIVAHRGWHLTSEDFIHDEDNICPMCALVNEINGDEVFKQAHISAAMTLRVSGTAAQAIALAADDRDEKALRRDLMAALGMTGR